MMIPGIRPTLLHAAALALVLPLSAMAADKTPKTHDCGDGRKLEVFQPKDGAMEARADDLIVRIMVSDGSPTSAAQYIVTVWKGEQSVGADPFAGEALPTACALVAGYYKALDNLRKAPSAEDLRKKLIELYEGL